MAFSPVAASGINTERRVVRGHGISLVLDEESELELDVDVYCIDILLGYRGLWEYLDYLPPSNNAVLLGCVLLLDGPLPISYIP